MTWSLRCNVRKGLRIVRKEIPCKFNYTYRGFCSETLKLFFKVCNWWRKQIWRFQSCRSWQMWIPKPCFPCGFWCALGYLCSERPKAEKLAEGWGEESSGRPRPNRWALSGLSSPKQPFHPHLSRSSGCLSFFFSLDNTYTQEKHTRIHFAED